MPIADLPIYKCTILRKYNFKTKQFFCSKILHVALILKLFSSQTLAKEKQKVLSSTLQRLHWKFPFDMRKDREKKIDMLHHLMTLHFLPEV